MRPLPLVGLAWIAAVACRGSKDIGAETGTTPIATDATLGLGLGPGDGLDASPGGFSGHYTSSVGPTTVTQQGDAVTLVYDAGRIDCVVHGETLACTWREGTATGRAKLTRLAVGHLVGTWGAGSSDSDGGEWRFVPAVALPDAIVPPLPPPMDARPPHPG